MLLAELGFLDWVGVVGSFVIAGAYFAVSGGYLGSERPPFQLFNLTGASMILTSLWYKPNAGAIMIEVLWVSIALYWLAVYFFKRR
ncbi:MAG: hypothetical protein GY947_00970 [Rhodobacteraceae bacterium]|nr:hypothetical protein [Paracoccaceae bacterium]